MPTPVMTSAQEGEDADEEEEEEEEGFGSPSSRIGIHSRVLLESELPKTPTRSGRREERPETDTNKTRKTSLLSSVVVVVVVVIVVVGHLKSLQPQKARFSSFDNNTGPTAGRTDGQPLIK